ncbi:preprotein translocase subunit SecA [Ureaplasma ceti]|uniref:Protein translocase subunit SecA n=1 Tax=Ureaplasma ceti TaxID=3119530 RepID=A0ABP9U9T3_9BACT
MRFNFLDKVTPAKRILDKASRIADKVIAQEEEYKKYSLEELRNITADFIERLARNEVTLDDILIDALSVIREAFDKVNGMRAYKVQLIGAIIVYFGDFAEMMTGEGKTLTLVLASYVGSLVKKGVHIVSVNEYLVQRDAEFSNNVLNKLGLTVGYIKSAMSPDEKKTNYNCDVTYCSNSELGFDYLRDNMVKRYEDKVQRGLHFAIVDEADSILIDEARTPLIISGSPANDITDYIQVDRFVKTLEPNDYLIDDESNSITLSDEGAAKAEAYFNVENIYDLEFSDKVHKISNALRANYLFSNGNEYIVKKDDKGKDVIALVDHFTGRIMEGRSYSAGLQQAIQAKEMVEIEPENLTVATVTYQSLFRQYVRLAGVSGTAYTEAEELLNIYNMVVVRIPTNRPIARIDQPDYVFGDKKTKWKYVIAEVIKRHKTGQPILIGTAAVEDSEILHLLLMRVGIPHSVLNAKNHGQEAEIIKHAGEKGQVTIATYMAGRGTDIKLTPEVKALGGLYVIGTERNESRRVDNQLRGRAGRQGDPGESRFFISLQDTLFKRFATDKFQKANTKMEDEVIDLKFFSRLLDNTQKKVEGLNYDTRKNLIDYDYVLSSQRELIYKQRDKILLSSNVLPLLKKMSRYVIDEILNRNRDEVNRDTINVAVVVEEFNNTVFHKELLKYDELKTLKAGALSEVLQKQLNEWLDEESQVLSFDQFNDYARNILIDNIDEAWTQHLDAVNKVREGVNLRAYEQRSPLNIYVADADKLFNELKRKIAIRTIKTISSINNPEFGGNGGLHFQEQPNINQDDELRALLAQTNGHYLQDIFSMDQKNFVWEMVLPQEPIPYKDIDTPVVNMDISTENNLYY